MAHWLIIYALGYLMTIIIIVRHDPLKDRSDYVLLGFIALFWPAIIFGIIPWLLKALIGRK